MFRNALRPAALPLLLALAAGAAPAQPGDDAVAAAPQPCITEVARAFNGVVPLLARVPREGAAELGPVIGRLNSLRGRIMDALEAPAPAAPSSQAADASCEALTLELAAQRQALQSLLPAPVPAEPAPVAPPAPVVTAPLAEPATPAAAPAAAPLPASLPPRPVAAPRPAERRAAVAVPAVPAVPAAPVKKAAYTLPPPPPAPRVDPQLEACRARVRQSHADAQLQLQLAARGGRIAQQKLPDMQRAQGRLAGLSGLVRGELASIDECHQLAQTLAQEVDQIQALAR